MLVDILIRMFQNKDMSLIDEVEEYINKNQKSAVYELMDICDITNWKETHEGVIALMNFAYDLLNDLMNHMDISFDDLWEEIQNVDGIH